MTLYDVDPSQMLSLMIAGESSGVHKGTEPTAIEGDEKPLVLVDLLSSDDIGSRPEVACTVGCAY